MKKGKVFGKAQVVLALMVMALGAAVWLNMKFTSNEKYLGEATYVSDSNTQSEAVATSAKVEESDANYFETARSDREDALSEAQQLVEETLKSADITDSEKQEAMQKVNEIAARVENANNIETLLKAKGFNEAVAVIGDNDINIIVKSDGITTTQTLQIQDIVIAQTNIALSNIKIVTVK